MQDYWFAVVCDEVADLIIRANFGRCPAGVEEWDRVCCHFCLNLEVVSIGRRGGVLLDNFLTVRNGPTERETGCRIAHELAEYLLRSEFSAPVCCSEASRHRTAVWIEAWYREGCH